MIQNLQRKLPYHICPKCKHKYYGGPDSKISCPYCEIERLKKSAEMLRMHLGNEKHEVGRLSRMLERKYRE